MEFPKEITEANARWKQQFDTVFLNPSLRKNKTKIAQVNCYYGDKDQIMVEVDWYQGDNLYWYVAEEALLNTWAPTYIASKLLERKAEMDAEDAAMKEIHDGLQQVGFDEHGRPEVVQVEVVTPKETCKWDGKPAPKAGVFASIPGPDRYAESEVDSITKLCHADKSQRQAAALQAIKRSPELREWPTCGFGGQVNVTWNYAGDARYVPYWTCSCGK